MSKPHNVNSGIKFCNHDQQNLVMKKNNKQICRLTTKNIDMISKKDLIMTLEGGWGDWLSLIIFISASKNHWHDRQERPHHGTWRWVGSPVAWGLALLLAHSSPDDVNHCDFILVIIMIITYSFCLGWTSAHASVTLGIQAVFMTLTHAKGF